MTTQVQVSADSISTLEKLMNSSLLTYIGLGILIYIAILWIAIILWVTKDIINRTNNVFMQILCISLVIFLTPIFGLVIYLIARPSKTLLERYYEDFELNLMEAEEDSTYIEHCPNCQCKIDGSFLYCSKCAAPVAHSCTSCEKTINLLWSTCPYCGITQDLPQEAPVEDKIEEEASLPSVNSTVAEEAATIVPAPTSHNTTEEK